MGLALAGTLDEPAFAAVVGWFPMQGRDRALLVVTLVAGLASTIFMPFEAWLVGRLGVRGTLAPLALILAAPTIPLHPRMLRRSPRGGRDAATARPGAAGPGLTARAAPGTRGFWGLALA